MTTAGGEALEGRVLILAPSGRDAVLAAALVQPLGIATHICKTGDDFQQALGEGAAVALVADEALTPALLEGISAVFARQEPWSDLPIVVLTARRADERQARLFHDRLTELGNVTILDRPLKPQSLRSALVSALRARTRQYQARALLHRIEREVRHRDQFLAMLGHELRNPLGAIQNASQLLRQRLGDDARVDRPLAVLARQSRHITRLVDDLLDVSRVSAGKITLQRQHLDLGQIAKAVVDQQRGFAAQQRVEVTLSLDHEAPVFGDPVRLDQVLTNVVGNAIKYTPAGGRVDVIVSREGQQIALRVRDTGVGMAAETLPYIFDLFSQSERSLDRAQGGMGIGLTLVRSVVELHGGTVTAASAGIGRGSEFTILLARSDTSAAARAKETAAPGSAARRLLIIDDNADNRESLQDLLEAYGHTVEVAADGPDGVARALSSRPETALVDIGLPGFDGFEVARRLRTALGRNIFLIALTGYGQPEDHRRTTAAGFDAHLTKPVEVDDIQRLLSAPRGGIGGVKAN